MRRQPAPWHLIVVIKITQKANDPMWASQHTVLYNSFTVYNIATLTTWTFIYYVTTARLKFHLRIDSRATTVLQQFHSQWHD